MASHDIQLCCFYCHSVTATSKNDWLQFDPSHIIPKQKPWYTSTEIEEHRKVGPRNSGTKEFHSITSSKASCTQCGGELGRYCRSGRGPNAKRFKEHVIYSQGAIYLRDAKSLEPLEPFFSGECDSDGRQNSRLSSVYSNDSTKQNPADHRWNPLGSDQEAPRQSVREEVDVEKLPAAVNALQDRMLSIEKTVYGIQRDLVAIAGRGLGQDALMHDFEMMLKTAKDARSSAAALEALRKENQQLKQTLDIKNPRKRKPPAEWNHAAASNAVVVLPPDSHCEQDLSTQIGGLAALDQITDAMSQPGPTSQDRRRSHNWSGQACREGFESSIQGIFDMKQGTYSNFDPTAGDGRLRGNPFAEGVADNSATEDPVRKGGNSAGTDDATSGSRHSNPDGNNAHATFEYANPQDTELQPTHSSALLDRNPVAAVSTATVSEMELDPALRSATTIPKDQHQDFNADVLSIVENPPPIAIQATPQSTIPSATQQNRHCGPAIPKYDSVHETRILQYKARDALRKRKATATAVEKMMKVCDDQFQEEERIRARDKMVQELMDREEMLGNDADL